MPFNFETSLRNVTRKSASTKEFAIINSIPSKFIKNVLNGLNSSL